MADFQDMDFSAARKRVDDLVATHQPSAAYDPADLPDFSEARKKVDAYVASRTPPPSSFWEKAKDTGIALTKGVIGVPEAVVGLVDLAQTPPLYAGQVGRNIARGRPINTPDALSPGLIGRTLQRGIGGVGADFQGAKAILDTGLSAQQREANRRVQEATGLWDTVKTTIRNPSTILQGTVESLPSMGAGGAVGRIVGKAAPALAKATPYLMGAIGEGAITAGQGAEQIRQATPGGATNPKQAALSTASGFITGLISAKGGKLAQKLGIADPDTILATGVNPATRRNVVLQLLAGAVSEGLIEEAPQSAQEQVAQNIATGKPWFDGVPQSTVQGMLAGAAMGGGANVLSSMARPGPGVTETAPGTPPPAQEQAESQLDAETEALFRQAEAEQAAQEAQGGVIQPQARQMPDLTPVAPYAVPGGAEPTMPAAELEGIMQGAVGDIRAEQRSADAAQRAERERAALIDLERVKQGVAAERQGLQQQVANVLVNRARGMERAEPASVEQPPVPVQPAPPPAVAEVTPQQGGVTPKPPAITSPATLARALTANPDMDLTGVKDEWLPVAATKVKGELKAKVQGEIERRKQPAPSAKPQELMTPDEYLASQKLRTAIRYPDGEIVVGNPGEIHAMVAARSGFENKGIPESGWWKDGKYLRPNEAKAIQGQGDARRAQQDARQKHEVALTMAQVNRNPVSAAAVGAYGIKLPPGYVREGDRYVFKGAPAPAQGGGQDVTEQADTEPPRIASTPVEEVNIADIKLSKDVPNFKRDADTETGEVRGQELKGKTYSRLPVNPVTVWERLNGARELITGRHRFALAKRIGEKTIPAQVVREADGFTKEMALTFDAEANIRDNQGSTEDHATYFRNTDISEEEASSRGLLDRDKGRKGWNIGKNASDDLYALYQIGGISDAKADAIARAGKGNADLQSVGIGYAKGHDVDQIIAYMQAVGASKPRGQQLDMFGRDSAWQQEADAIGKAVVEVKNELRAELTALRAAKTAGKEKNAATLKKYGFKAGDVKKVDARIEDLTRLAEEWDRWVTDPNKVAIARERAGLKPIQPAVEQEFKEQGKEEKNEEPVAPPLTLEVQTAEQVKAEREAKEAAEAKAKAEANKPPPKPTNVPMDTTGDMFDQSKADFPLFATPTPKQEAPGTQTAEIPAILDAALRWQGAHMNAEVEYKERGDKRGQYKIASESGKSVLDSYLMKRFGIDRNAAHEITNEITQRNLAPIRDAKVDEFAGEPWADKTIADRRPPGPGTRGGPGAAAASGTLEFIPRAKESGSDYTGLQRAISDLERESLGLPPYTVDAARRFPDIVEGVWANMQANPDYAAQLNDELRDTPRPVSDSEAATLLILKVQRFNERNAAAQSNDPARLKEAQAKLESTFDAISRAGTETGRALNAFKMAMDERYSLVELEASLRASKGGESATTEELAKLRKVADEYARANRELNDRMAKLSESQTAANEALKAKDEELRNAKMKEEFARLILAKMPPYQASKKPTPRIVEFATARANAARERMKARSGQLFAGVDPQVITDLADIGMEYIVKGAVDLMQFTDRMVKDFGEKVLPYLQDVHAAAMKMLGHEQGRERVEASKRKVPQGDKAPTEQPGYDPATIKELFKDQADMGVTDPQEALTAVHEIIKETNPAMTREQVRDSFSDYGKVKPPSADPVKQTLADWRRQYQLLASIELVAKRLEPLKTGLQRQKPSATVRELTRKLNKMMKEAGINPIDPQTQLASALSGIKSRLENRIEELSKALATGERITLDKNAVPYDEQAKALAAERDELQAMYDQAFPPKPPTYDQQVNLALKAAERNLSALNKRLEDARMGKFTGRPLKPSSVWTAELADLKNQQKAIREEIEQLKEAANPKKSPELLAIEQRRKRDEAVIRELERRIREKDFEPRQRKFIDISGDPEAMAAAERKAKVRAEFAQLKEEARRSKLGKFDKLKEWGIRVYDLSRDTKSSFDVSAPGRQGYPVLFINTKIWANATRAMFKGMRRENSAVLMQRIRERPAYRKGWYRFLALSEDDGMGNYSNVDDRFQLAVINHVPGLAASNRAYAVFLNELRVNLFDYLMEQMPNPQNPSIADLKAVSEDVNIFTGKGKLPGGSAVGASRILYAPSFIKASWDIITGKPMRTGNIPLRNLMARQYAKVLLGTAALVSMASMWGGDDDEGVEYDMTSSDFGTVKFGHYRVGLVSYLRPMLTFMARKIQGYKKVEKNGRIEYVRLTDDVPAWVDESELTVKVPYGGGMDQVDWQFLKSKLHPGISAIRSMISGQDFGGRKIGKAEAVYQMFAPITAEQIREMSKTENIDALVMLTILNAFGFDVRPDYNDPTIKKQLNEERNK